ncbi:MAG TPA: S9 family peptidase [Longimicrobium sp.]|jgi:dipeptidyl aminopeptidase/acylaminoacyl peptidase
MSNDSLRCQNCDEDALTEAVRALAAVGAAISPSFAPDGNRIAFVTRLSGSPQVWTVASEGGWPDQVTAFDDPVSGVKWSPDGELLAVAVAPGGGLNEQVYLLRPDGSGVRRITDGGKDNNWLIDWTRDGRLMLASNRDGDGMDAYLYGAAAGTMRKVAANPGVGHLTDVSRDGALGVLYRQQSRGDDDLFLVDLRRGGETRLTPHQGPGSFAVGRFSPDGSTIYLSSNADRDLVAFARVRLGADGRPGPIEVLAARDDAELDEFALAEDGRTAALFWNVAGRSELAFVDLASGRVEPGPPLPAEVVGGPYERTGPGSEFSRDGRRLVLALWGPAAPSDLWVLDLATRRFTQATRSPHPGVDLSALARPELVEYAAHDGLPLSGWLYRPRGARGPGPVVLNFHGGPEGQERPIFRSDYQALVARGISVFGPNVRGSSGFGKRFVNLDNGALRVDAVRDIESTVDHLVRAGVADPRRVGIMGGSYGGYMVMSGLADYPEKFAAGANLYGVVNFETFFANTEPWMAAISTVEYGDPSTEADLLRRLSPIHRVDRVTAPTLVLHGANDTNVPVVEAEQVVESLKRRGVPVEYVLFPDEGHGWRKTANRIRSAVAIVSWFDRYLNRE